jgi:hypothetical protein
MVVKIIVAGEAPGQNEYMNAPIMAVENTGPAAID